MPKKKYLPGHEVKLLHSGEEYFHALEKLISSAKNVIHLQVYIFDDDATGKRIINALHAAIERKVKIFLMVDGFGSYSLNREFRNRMKEYGIHFRYFSPLPFPGITQMARRLHHKVCVIDSSEAIVGGINIADKYNGSTKEKPWLDYAVHVKGFVCKEIDTVCNTIWKRNFVSTSLQSIKSIGKSHAGVLLRMSRNDWFRGKNEISAAYKSMLYTAQNEIIIVASYFIPTRRLLKILIREAKRGKNVQVILSHNSDVPFIKGAMTYLYERMLLAGIKLFEYNDGILHAKVCVVDRHWVSIGSHNLNHLSEYISMEMNIEILDDAFAISFTNELHTLIKTQCTEISLKQHNQEKSGMKQFLNWISFRSISIVQRLLYMLNRREGKQIRKSKKSNYDIN